MHRCTLLLQIIATFYFDAEDHQALRVILKMVTL